MRFVMGSCLATEGDTADREAAIPVVVNVDRGANSVWIEIQAVGEGTTTADGGPVVAIFACEVQATVWMDISAPDKHQRRLHNSICIS